MSTLILGCLVVDFTAITGKVILLYHCIYSANLKAIMVKEIKLPFYQEG